MRNQLHASQNTERESQQIEARIAFVPFGSPELAQPAPARPAALTADAGRLAVHHHPALSGSCVECGKQTESIVRSTPTRAEFLCPPCGRAIREAA